jgi:hypothetical protein
MDLVLPLGVQLAVAAAAAVALYAMPFLTARWRAAREGRAAGGWERRRSPTSASGRVPRERPP